MLEAYDCDWQVRLASLVENNFNAVERLDEYAALKDEAPTHIPGSKPDNWPSNGKVNFRAIVLTRHRVKFWDNIFLTIDDIPQSWLFQTSGAFLLSRCTQTYLMLQTLTLDSSQLQVPTAVVSIACFQAIFDLHGLALADWNH